MPSRAASLRLAFLCYGDEENGHCACTSVHLTTANQSEIREAYLVSEINRQREIALAQCSITCYARACGSVARESRCAFPRACEAKIPPQAQAKRRKRSKMCIPRACGAKIPPQAQAGESEGVLEFLCEGLRSENSATGPGGGIRGDA